MPFDGRELPQVTQNLIIARDHIEDNGWCQNKLVGPYNRTCVYGSILKSFNKEGYRWSDVDVKQYYRAVFIADIFVRANGIKSDLSFWNDTPGRTKEEVLAAFDKAIAYSLEHQEETAAA